MKRTLILLTILLILAGCVTQVNTTSQANNPPQASASIGFLPKFLNLFKLLK